MNLKMELIGEKEIEIEGVRMKVSLYKKENNKYMTGSWRRRK